jgi:2-polyprenyl-3-methyl-5-hydroxy-6-metoxy-1,4-benzoquinol methylase
MLATAKINLIPDKLIGVLKPSSGLNDAVLERAEGGFRVANSGTFLPDEDGVPSLLASVDTSGRDQVTGKIKAFYEEHPFPNYDGIQSYGDLVRRGEANPFSKGLLDAIGYNKLVLECGCGTGQLSHFLSLNNNHVLGIDLSTSSLRLALEHKLRNSVPRVAFVQMNIFELGIKDETFDVVISSGVLHHTRDARRAFGEIVKKTKPGGIVIVGLYNWFARVPTWLRSKLLGVFGPNIDYVVRNRIRDARKAEIWLKDQYYNPHETWHSIDEVLGWFRDNKIDYLNCRPPILGRAPSGMFEPTGQSSKAMRVLTQLSWLGSISSEGALFVLAGRRRS